MRSINYFIGLIMIVLASFVIYASKDFVSMGTFDIGADTFPKGIAILTIILSIVLILTTYFNKNIFGRFKDVFEKRGLAKVGVGLALFIIYFTIMSYIGFLISTVLFLGCYLYILGIRNWYKIIVISILTSFIVFYVFYQFFNVQIPEVLF
jgi:putative tricarboxylic transport membrane protein